MEKSKFEFSAVLPGTIAETTQDDTKVFINEPRLAICMNIWTAQIKGKIHKITNGANKTGGFGLGGKGVR